MKNTLVFLVEIMNNRIRGRTLRTESLDRSNAKDLAQVVRILREVDVSPVSPSSTTRIHGIAPRNGASFYDIYSINIPCIHSI